jgi:hypothetical protein
VITEEIDKGELKWKLGQIGRANIVIGREQMLEQID